MAFPSKISPETIRDAALAILEAEGESALTLRRIAKALRVVPNALYHHYRAREHLMAVVADEVAGRVLAAIDAGLEKSGLPPSDARGRVRCLATSYTGFARAHPALYQGFMAEPCDLPDGPPLVAHEALWDRVIEVLAPLAGENQAASAAVALWGLLHGFWVLERSNLRSAGKLGDALSSGLEAFIRGLGATVC